MLCVLSVKKSKKKIFKYFFFDFIFQNILKFWFLNNYMDNLLLRRPVLDADFGCQKV